MTLRPCLDCGEPTYGTRCPWCKRPDQRGSAHERGYDHRWQKLSAKARKLQPWCSDCYTTHDLTTDHSERAWRRREAGKSIRLRDVDVVCRSCNAKRGRARQKPGEIPPARTAQRPSPDSKFASHTTERD